MSGVAKRNSRKCNDEEMRMSAKNTVRLPDFVATELPFSSFVCERACACMYVVYFYSLSTFLMHVSHFTVLKMQSQHVYRFPGCFVLFRICLGFMDLMGWPAKVI